VEPGHLKSEGFLFEIGRIPKGDRQIDLPKGQGSLPWYDTVEGCFARAELGSTDLHGIKGFSVHDVEATASVHQYLGELRVADDGVDNQRISAPLRDTIRVVIMIEHDGRSRPVEEGRHGWLSGVDFSAFQFTLAPRIIGREAAKDHEAIVDVREVVVFLPAVAPIVLGPFAGIAFPLGTPEEVAFHHATLLEGMFDRVPVVWARFVEHLIKNSRASLGRGLGVLALGNDDKGILAWLLGLLFFEVAARAAFVGVLLLLLLSLGVMENCPYCFLIGSKVGGNV
jgi:hypothetical protein